jgi:hypothetical protein
MAYSRPLRDVPSVKQFLEILEFPIEKCPKIISSIINTERIIFTYESNDSTLISKAFRIESETERERWKLRMQIVDELANEIRLEDDDKICLGRGGSLPKSEIQQNKQAFIITGLPASGKSSISNIFSEEYGAVILDSDYAKRKLPEFEEFGASIVHDESDALILGSNNMLEKPKDFRTLLELCSQSGSNIVLPKIGHDSGKMSDLAKTLRNIYGYSVHLTLVSLDRKIAVSRAIHRFHETKRYVPIGLIFDDYSNEPTNTYHKLKNENKNSRLFESFGIINTDVEKGAFPQVIEYDNNNPAHLFVIEEKKNNIAK